MPDHLEETDLREGRDVLLNGGAEQTVEDVVGGVGSALGDAALCSHAAKVFAVVRHQSGEGQVPGEEAAVVSIGLAVVVSGEQEDTQATEAASAFCRSYESLTQTLHSPSGELHAVAGG